MTAGRDYSLVALSIDPSETSADAAAAKADDLQRYPAPGAAQNWHFLTGTADAVQAVADAVGFHDRFDPELKQFAHPVGIVFATPAGIVSSYLLGVGYQPADVRLGVTRAAIGKHRGCGVAGPVAVLRLRSDDGAVHARHHEAVALGRGDHGGYRRGRVDSSLFAARRGGHEVLAPPGDDQRARSRLPDHRAASGFLRNPRARLWSDFALHDQVPRRQHH